MSTAFSATEHTTLRRDDRASFDADTIHAILDAAPLCHVGIVDRGRPVVIPMLHVRIGDTLMLHGSHATRLFRTMKGTPVVCVTVTILDGLVLARSAFHHSANYRSVVLFGRPEQITDPEARRSALDALVDKTAPGRRPYLRPMTDKEIQGTAMVAIPIEEASAKIRTGPPIDDEADHELPIWAGVVPVSLQYGDPVPDPRLHPDATAPEVPGFFHP